MAAEVRNMYQFMVTILCFYKVSLYSLTAAYRVEFLTLFVLAVGPGSSSSCWFLSVLAVELPLVCGSRSCRGCCFSCMSLTSFTAASSLLVWSDGRGCETLPALLLIILQARVWTRSSSACCFFIADTAVTARHSHTVYVMS